MRESNNLVSDSFTLDNCKLKRLIFPSLKKKTVVPLDSEFYLCHCYEVITTIEYFPTTGMAEGLKI